MPPKDDAEVVALREELNGLFAKFKVIFKLI